MKLASLALWALALLRPQAVALRDESPERAKRVAIIGAGAAGASTAYHIRRFADVEGLEVNITVFEKRAVVGGRARVVYVYDNQAEPFELGASDFIEDDHILWNASLDFNLTKSDPDYDETGKLAVWDGERFVFQESFQSWNWWNTVKMYWKYGLSPYRMRKLVEQSKAKVTQLYHEPHFPFRSLTTRAYELELTYATGQTGEQYLSQNKISPLYAHDIVQACTRINFASNLAYIHGLDTLGAIAYSRAAQIVNGNWQLFDRMISASGAQLRLNASVASIALASSEKPARYKLETESTEALSDGETEELAYFDYIVLATPYQFSGIKVGDDVLQHSVDEIPYVKLHVTAFTSPFSLHSGFFHLPPASEVPSLVLTTLGEDEVTGDPGAGKAGFFSISTHKMVTNPKTGLPEHLYKILSAEEITPKFLSALLGVRVPGTFTGQPEDYPQMVEPVSWIHAHAFRAYPKAYPRVTFQDPILGDGLYYTSGMESFVSTMETNALMGMNVARLILDDVTEKQEDMQTEARSSQEYLDGKRLKTEPMEEL